MYGFEHLSILDNSISGRVWADCGQIVGSLARWLAGLAGLARWLAGSRARGQILGRLLGLQLEQLKTELLDNRFTDSNMCQSLGIHLLGMPGHMLGRFLVRCLAGSLGWLAGSLGWLAGSRADFGQMLGVAN